GHYNPAWQVTLLRSALRLRARPQISKPLPSGALVSGRKRARVWPCGCSDESGSLSSGLLEPQRLFFFSLYPAVQMINGFITQAFGTGCGWDHPRRSAYLLLRCPVELPSVVPAAWGLVPRASTPAPPSEMPGRRKRAGVWPGAPGGSCARPEVPSP